MTGVLEKRREYLRLMRQCTLDAGYFTVTDISRQTGIPRSTAQDWINRLLSEQCIGIIQERRGRYPARYASRSAIPQSACRRIFTTLDGDKVEIYHECLSGSCAAFCEYHHRLSGGVLTCVSRDGTLLRECASMGEEEAVIGLHPKPAVGVVGVRKNSDGTITQRIRCLGGPAYSLTDMMSQAEGVCNVQLDRNGGLVEGEVTTRALTYGAVGIDDTDSQDAGATFAIALALLQVLSTIRGVIPIGHRVVMLNPAHEGRTAGNAASFIELALEPSLFDTIIARSHAFVADESYSGQWGIAVKKGFMVSQNLRHFGERVRTTLVTNDEAWVLAEEEAIYLAGGRGTIGALASLGFIGLETSVLLNPEGPVPPG